jgi:hypothetical protein
MLENKQLSKFLYNFIVKNQSLCKQAFDNNWLGYFIDRDTAGLLGYMRYSYKKQLKVLENNNSPIGFPFLLTKNTAEIYNFFNSDFFNQNVVKNNSVVDFYSKDHFTILEKMVKFKKEKTITFENWTDWVNKYYKSKIEKQYEDTIF